MPAFEALYGAFIALAWDSGTHWATHVRVHSWAAIQNILIVVQSRYATGHSTAAQARQDVRRKKRRLDKAGVAACLDCKARLRAKFELQGSKSRTTSEAAQQLLAAAPLPHEHSNHVISPPASSGPRKGRRSEQSLWVESTHRACPAERPWPDAEEQTCNAAVVSRRLAWQQCYRKMAVSCSPLP
jgi:hypothetical protein